MTNSYKGIVLAGGSGSRLWPITQGVSKQLLPIYDKPMIYYPLSVLFLAGIREILIITTPEDNLGFRRLLGDGAQFGINLQYRIQERPDGLATAFTLARDFLDGSPACLVLGDNIFYGEALGTKLKAAINTVQGGTIFGYRVHDPKRFGVIEFGSDGKVVSVEEKPEEAKSDFAITGLYFFDANVVNIASKVQPSKRGEYEITDVIDAYLKQGKLAVQLLGRGYAWLDSGTHSSLLDAAQFVEVVQRRQGYKIACLEEIAYNNGWIDRDMLLAAAARMQKNDYGAYLERLAQAGSNLRKSSDG